MSSNLAFSDDFGTRQNTYQRSRTSSIVDRAERKERTVKVLFNPSISTSSVIRINPTFRTSTSTSNKLDSKAVRVLSQKIRIFSKLSKNWDGYNGNPAEHATIIDAIALLKKLPEQCLPCRAGISSDGEISLIWERKDLFADLGVDGDGTFSYFIQNGKQKLYGDDIKLSNGIPTKAINALKK